MAARSPETKIIERDAKEFGVSVRCGGWRLGLLVARNVEHGGSGGRPPANRSPENGLGEGKVSMSRFAELAGVSKSHVSYYFNAWELASKAGLVPNAATLSVGDDEVDVEAESIEVEDNPRTHWSHFYQLAKNPPEKKPEKPKKKEDSEQVDQDFGLTDSDDDDSDDSLTEEQQAEADSSILRNELLEVLESLRSVESRLTRIGSVPNDPDGLLGQIASAALDLNTMSNAMMTVSETVEA